MVINTSKLLLYTAIITGIILITKGLNERPYTFREQQARTAAFQQGWNQGYEAGYQAGKITTEVWKIAEEDLSNENEALDKEKLRVSNEKNRLENKLERLKLGLPEEDKFLESLEPKQGAQ